MSGGMPLELLPPPSPCGKKPSHPKHTCLSAELCLIKLSDIGKHYHSFPKGSFKAHFIPPSAPRFVLKHLIAHPLTWTWTTKDGPNKGHSFQVPTTPIHCDKAAPKAIHWIVAIFHSFKAHLNPITLSAESGKVKPGWLRLYQNNLYIHLQGQMKGSSGPARANPSTPNPPPTIPLKAPSTAAPVR
ncbi:hypothetical protein EDC04DRAFT_2973225 [Pisolithus marmoratus]|nr:hypothetical protein EDC04DRAFT_2973225 [Pisolithus marmoratus]